ncbi:MAG: hypothetical protein WC966_06915 [Bradymonadales bacterium]
MCVNPNEDVNHCGGCNDAGGVDCSLENKICKAGLCQSTNACLAPNTLCGSDCVDTQSSAKHCGDCNDAGGVDCSLENKICKDGVCQSTDTLDYTLADPQNYKALRVSVVCLANCGISHILDQAADRSHDGSDDGAKRAGYITADLDPTESGKLQFTMDAGRSGPIQVIYVHAIDK